MIPGLGRQGARPRAVLQDKNAVAIEAANYRTGTAWTVAALGHARLVLEEFSQTRSVTAQRQLLAVETSYDENVSSTVSHRPDAVTVISCLKAAKLSGISAVSGFPADNLY